MKLYQALKGVTYRISKIETHEENHFIMKRLFHLGIMEGSNIVLKQKAPLFSDPLLFESNGLQVAFTKSEASLVSIEQVEV